MTRRVGTPVVASGIGNGEPPEALQADGGIRGRGSARWRCRNGPAVARSAVALRNHKNDINKKIKTIPVMVVNS